MPIVRLVCTSMRCPCTKFCVRLLTKRRKGPPTCHLSPTRAAGQAGGSAYITLGVSFHQLARLHQLAELQQSEVATRCATFTKKQAAPQGRDRVPALQHSGPSSRDGIPWDARLKGPQKGSPKRAGTGWDPHPFLRLAFSTALPPPPGTRQNPRSEKRGLGSKGPGVTSALVSG